MWRNLKSKIENQNHKYKYLNKILNNEPIISTKPIWKTRPLFKIEVGPKDINATKYNFYSYKLQQLSCYDYDHISVIAQPLPRELQESHSFYEYSKAYLQFLKIINLNADKCSVKTFNLPIFQIIFRNKYNDSNINLFIEKVLEDPFNYEKEERKLFYEVNRYVYYYCANLNLNNFKNKIKTILIKHQSCSEDIKSEFNYKITNEKFVDSLSLKNKHKGGLYDEAIFLNGIYREYISKNTSDLKILELFLKRFIENISNIESIYLEYFIREVFLHQTVLLTLTESLEIYKFVFNIVKNKIGFREIHYQYIYKYVNIILEKENMDIKIYDAVIKESRFILDYLLLKNGLIAVYKLRMITNINEIKNLICENQESFNNISSIINELKILLYVGTLKNSLALLQITLQIIKYLKHEFLIQLAKTFVDILKKLFASLTQQLSTNNSTALYNQLILVLHEIRDNLSFFILFVQQNDLSSTSKKKEKNKAFAKSKSTCSTMKLIEIIRNFEMMINAPKKKDGAVGKICILKERSFKILEINK